MTRPQRIVLPAALIVIAVGAVLWYLQSLNTPLEVFNILNPRKTPPANLTPVLPETLTPVPVAVPEQWQNDVFRESRMLELPEGFSINVFASGFSKARFLALGPTGTVFVSDMDVGKVFALPDRDRDGAADERIVFAENLNQPHGITYHDGAWYVAENDKVRRWRDTNGDLRADENAVVIPNLPSGGGHVTRTVVFGDDDALYVSVGSSCNVCQDDARRAAVLRFDPDGNGETVFSSGLRNAVGVAIHPTTGELWVTENGRDLLGDDTPPDEVNVLAEGKHFGWPFCYGKRIADTSAGGTDEFCSTTEPSRLDLQAHSAPLGLRFYYGTQFPNSFQEALLIAYHGSWNRREPTGYKVIVADTRNAEPAVRDFVRGWLVDGKAWGRPVDVLVGSSGELYVSDDHANVIYRVTYSGRSGR